jgi:hypothetical protein
MHIPYDAPPNNEQMAGIISEFEQHDCAIQFAVSRERLKRALSA